MSEDICAKPDLTKIVRFQKDEMEECNEKEDRNDDIYDNPDNHMFYENCWAKETTPPKLQDNTKDQQQTVSVNGNLGKKNHVRAATVFLVLLCLLLLVAVIVLVVFAISYNEMKSLNAELSRQKEELQTNYSEMMNFNANLTSERDQLQTSYNEMKSLNAELSRQKDKLQTNYSEMMNFNANLTQKTSQLVDENRNLTKQRDGLQKMIENSCCPENWKRFGIKCYLISISSKTWYDSKQFCESLDAQLVTISNKQEQEYFSSFGQNYWIGLSDLETTNVYKWVSGAVVGTTYWGAGQPDHYIYGETEHCAMITNWISPQNWNDYICSGKFQFICEKKMN